MEYLDFLAQKHLTTKPSGFEVQGEILDKLHPFQRAVVRWSLRLGKAAQVFTLDGQQEKGKFREERST